MLRRTIQVIRWVLVVLLVALAQACSDGRSSVPTQVDTPTQNPPATSLPFRCGENGFRVDLLDAIGAVPDGTLEAQREQLRDWIWTVTLGRHAQRRSAGDGEALAPLAAQLIVRDDALSPAFDVPAGSTRVAPLKGGDVIVMVEHASKDVMDAEVLEAIDQQALYLGHTPGLAWIYEYEFQLEAARAEICPAGQLARTQLEAASRGYRRETITSTADMKRFLAGGVDLLSAQCSAYGLQVTGRERPRSHRAQVTVEQIAPLTQKPSVEPIEYIPTARLGATLDSLSSNERANIEIASKAVGAWLAALSRGHTLVELGITSKAAEEAHMFSRWKEQYPDVATEELVLSFILQRQLQGTTLFSLDPLVRVETAVESLDQVITALASPVSLGDLLRSWGEGNLNAKKLAGNLGRQSKANFERAQKELRALRDRVGRVSDKDVRLILIGPRGDSASLNEPLARDLAVIVERRSVLQCARYSDRIQGTATGMTFFYTDFMMKTSLFEWPKTAPHVSALGFENVGNYLESAATYYDGMPPMVAMYLGVDDEQYAREPLGGARFAPIATRVFGKAIEIGTDKPTGEPPGAIIMRALRWWNTHYKSVAEGEPQYEILNQLMKWSVVVQSAATTGDRACLRFLDDVSISNGLRFDHWVEETEGLGWRGPVDLVSVPDKQLECLPLLTSETFRACGREHQIHGGVLGATLGGVLAKPLVVSGAGVAAGSWVAAALGNFGIETTPEIREPGRVTFDRIRRKAGELKKVVLERLPDRVKFRAKVEASTGQKSAAVKDVEKTLEIKDNVLVGRESIDGVLTSELKASDLAAAEVRLTVSRASLDKVRPPNWQLERAAVELKDALSKGDLAKAEGIVGEAVQGTTSSKDILTLRGKLAQARADAVRAGADTTRLDQMTVRLAIAERSQLTGGLLNAQARAVSSIKGPRYAPPDYPAQAGLPPVVHPSGRLLGPSERFVSRILDQSVTGKLQEKLVAGDRVLELVPGGSSAVQAIDTVGSPLRLLGALGLPVAVVLPCDDNRWDLPPCHEIERDDIDRLIHRIDISREKHRVLLCDRDRDGKLSAQEERACVLPRRHRASASKNGGAAP